MDDVVLGKVETIERCVRPVREVCDGDSIAFRGMIGFRNVAVHD